LCLGLINVILSQPFWALSMEQHLDLGLTPLGRVVLGGLRSEECVDKGLTGLGSWWLIS
jgi:hypothetical protein